MQFVESSSSFDLPTETDIASILTPLQYSDVFRSVNTLPEDSDLGPHIRVVDRLSATEERDHLLRQGQHIRGIVSVARKGHKRRKKYDNSEDAVEWRTVNVSACGEPSDCHF